jgi:hypothetical protein
LAKKAIAREQIGQSQTAETGTGLPEKFPACPTAKVTRHLNIRLIGVMD